MRILILEDGSWVADELARMLRRQGCAVELARSSEQAVRTAAAQTFDLLILDLSLRVVDGARLLRALEDQRDRVPLLVLTAREQVDERVQALELGADCLAEPFAMPELAARVRALIRRSRSREDARRLVHGPLVVDSDARRAYLAGEPLALVPREWAVLEVLLRQAERVVSKESISQSIAGCGKPVSANTIETYVSRLRAKLEPAGIRIRTVHRVGYMLEAAHEFRAAAAAS
ncbi:MAG TPA: response regulator transcription factor [Burkholderiales bacterium]